MNKLYEYAMKAAMALIANFNNLKFDRKNYFYFPDNQSLQISQFDTAYWGTMVGLHWSEGKQKVFALSVFI